MSPAVVLDVGEHRRAARQRRAMGQAQHLPQREVDAVEGRAERRDVAPRRLRRDRQPRAVEMGRDALGARRRHRGIHRRHREDLVEAPPHRRLDDHRADALLHAPDARGTDRRHRGLRGEARARRLHRHQRQPHHPGGAVAGVGQDMALRVDEHAPREARAEPVERQHVGERAGREEHRALLAKPRREQRLGGAHRVRLAVLVRGVAGEPRRRREPRGVLRGRGIVAVGVEVDHAPSGGTAPLRSTIMR